ncbi:MAG: DUF4870 domain-containing protein [candidate division KSB1 bacterium]|nr:DUF4870 domain-containing protein [candidate division KSB1 bacterium]
MDTVSNASTHGQTATPVATHDQNTWAMLCHLSTFAGFIIPFGNIVGPLLVWLIKKDEFPLVEDQGKEALNFQISMTIYIIASIVLILLLIGIPLLVGLCLFDIIVTVIAAIKANQGEKFRYPLAIRLIN